MRIVRFLVAIVALIGAGVFLFMLTERGRGEPASAGADLGPPPPCYASWDAAKAAGVFVPNTSSSPGRIVISGMPLPTRGPPFDMTKTPPPPGFSSWAEVIAGWKKAHDAGLLDIAPSTPDVSGPPPPGCASWDDFAHWAERQLSSTLNGSP
jgi:hypothetical protein